MATEQLFYQDQYIKAFDAEVTKCLYDDDGNVKSVALDRTAFYPEGGGQPSDMGVIALDHDNAFRVTYVHEDRDGDIWHDVEPLPVNASGSCDCEREREGECECKGECEGKGKRECEGECEVERECDGEREVQARTLEVGAKVHGELDWDRRFELMQQHLGEHMLSAVFVRDFDARNVAMRMDIGAVSIDLDKTVSADDLDRAERAVNDEIYKNIKVEILYPDDLEEICAHSRRGMPHTDKAIRVVKVGDLDYVPCCGVHNATTAEVGLIKILKAEPHKGGTRVHFLCGREAYRRVAEICAAASHTARELRCQDQEIFDRVEALLNELKDTKNRVKALIDAAAERKADELIFNAHRGTGQEHGELRPVTVVHVFSGVTSTEEMKAVFTALTAHEGVTALLGGKTEKGAFLIFGCHKNDKRVDVRPAFKAAIELIDGKGGGSAFCAQGYGHDLEHLSEAVSQAGRMMLGE